MNTTQLKRENVDRYKTTIGHVIGTQVSQTLHILKGIKCKNYFLKKMQKFKIWSIYAITVRETIIWIPFPYTLALNYGSTHFYLNLGWCMTVYFQQYQFY